MPLSTYADLQTSILSWLARPGDPLVSPAVPDMIQLFEREATRRLKVGGAEKRVSLTALSAAVALPSDFGELRLATSGGVILTYVTPMQLPDGGGSPAHYTIIGNEMRLGPSPSGGCTIEIVYQSGVPPLSDTNPSNWLLAQHPDCYLFGALVEAESFIGQDDRIPLWAQRREAAFSSIESADRKARWGGAPLSIRADGVSGGNGTAAGDWTSAPPVPIPIVGIVAGDGLTGGGSEGIVTLALDAPVAIANGGTGATTAPGALSNLGAAPLDSPVFTGNPQAPTPLPGDSDTSVATTAFIAASYATIGSLAAYAPLASPALTGNPTAPTPAPGDNDTSISTTAFVSAAIAAAPNQTITLTGDSTGAGTASIPTTVVQLQGRAVANTAPSTNQVLSWSGTAWAPITISGAGTMTSVTAGAGLTASPNPIIGAGTLALTVPVSVANGGTGATTAGAALTSLGALPLAGGTMTGALIGTSHTLSTPLGVASGGTGMAANTSNAILTGGGAGPVNSSLALVNPLTGNIAAGPNLSLGDGASSTAGIEIAPNRVADGGSYIDFHAQTGAGDFDMRLIRAAGANGAGSLQVNGTGNLELRTSGYLASLSGASGFFNIAGTGGAADTVLTIGAGRTVAGNAYLDFYTGASTSTPEMRIIRASGAAGNAAIQHNSTAPLYIDTNGINRASFGDLGNGVVFSAGGIIAAVGVQARPGSGGPGRSNIFNIDWTGTSQIWIDNVLQGTINVTCDYRIKENVIDLPSTWDRVKALRPITYNRADNPELLSVADPTERWGFIAHELQEALTESAASGYKDAPNEVQGPDTLAVLAAVTKALQEAMARIESLEAVMPVAQKVKR